MTDNTGDWEKELLKNIKEGRKVTKSSRDPKKRRWAFSEAPNYRVFETSPNQKLDKGKTYLISGTESQIILQASLIKALHDILGNRLGYTIDFETWFEDFSFEFKYNPITNKPRFIINEDDVLSFWGVDREERPSFEWIEPSQEENKKTDDDKQLNYIVIKFYKNRKQKNDFIFVTGTESEVRMQLLDLMKVTTTASNSKPGYGEYISNKGKPKVVLYFLEKIGDVEFGYRQIDAKITFRLNNLSEKWDDPDKQNLTLSDIEQLAVRIKNEFCTPTLYKFKKGKTTVSYRDKKHGMESYSYFYSKQNGVALYQKICNIAQIQYEPKFCKVTESEDVVNAYPTIPLNENVLGEQVKGERIRPVGDVYFEYAVLSLSSLSRNIILVSSNGSLFDSSQFDLNKYK
ncbi:hypothetical protein [Planktothrix sp. FACHB-1365]|uniref:hypothetical protein n=1 Tax=Planktothrix sp. FACHB-1365 TaxID=2692855 RepID=UPI001687C0BE|nr:hypothetical protein [Planktothrix sp. FACHB-1365]MBD2481547.1 hypothetical protein [Planktothrix sp. FACHB-1365]